MPAAHARRKFNVRNAARRRPPSPCLRTIEELESRWLLAGVPFPTTVDPSSVDQTLWAPERVEVSIRPGSVPAVAGGALYRFAVDGPGYSDVATFHLRAASAAPLSDAALALFDTSGNLIASADTDPDPSSPGMESLSAELINGSVYVLGAYFQPLGPPVDYLLSVEPGWQVTNTPLTIDPDSGTITFVANSGEDALTGPRDVDYYPLDLTNGGSGGNVTITPLGLDGEIFASLYRRLDSSEPWRIVDSAGHGAGGPVQLNLTPPIGKNLTDAEFMLSISTENFDGGPGGYQIHVAAGPVLAPTTVTPALATDLFTLEPVSPGVLGVDDGATVPIGEATLYRLRAAETGTMALGVTSPLSTVVSVYDETGTNLVEVFTGQPGSPVARDVSVVGGTAYHVRVEPKSVLTPGTFSLSLRSSYTPQSVDISGGPATVATPIGPAVTGMAYRVATTSSDDVLVVQVETDPPAEYQVVVVGAGDGDLNPFVTDTAVAAGDPLVLPVDIAGEVGPFDIFIQGTSTPATATIKVGVIDIPTTILKGTVADESVGTDDAWNFERTTSGFGAMAGAQFVELQRDTSQPEPLGATLTANGQTGAGFRVVPYRSWPTIGRWVRHFGCSHLRLPMR